METRVCSPIGRKSWRHVSGNHGDTCLDFYRTRDDLSTSELWRPREECLALPGMCRFDTVLI
eukprot:1348327-Amorphochlora_amoeboformis.AAC.1